MKSYNELKNENKNVNKKIITIIEKFIKKYINHKLEFVTEFCETTQCFDVYIHSMVDGVHHGCEQLDCDRCQFFDIVADMKESGWQILATGFQVENRYTKYNDNPVGNKDWFCKHYGIYKGNE